ncbi:MAG: cytochrome c oxidase subunit 3 [Rhodospirillales bacterium]
MSGGKTHPYHLVDPSPWPLVGAFGALLMAIGGIQYMHGASLWFVLPGFAIVIYVFYVWCRDVVRESNAGLFHTDPVAHGLRFGMVLFITSEVMFFFAFFWAWFDATVPAISRTAHEVWPPEGIMPFDPWGLPFLNTLILLTSGATVTWAHHALRVGDRKGLVNGLILTVLLGVMFTALQAYEYSHAGFSFSDGIYASGFFLATGFHGFHVIVGTIFLFVCLMRAIKGDFSPDKHIGFEAAAWYWHFVDVVWLFLFCAVYWWGAGTYDFG